MIIKKYIDALKQISIDKKSNFTQFFIYAEVSAIFYSKHFEMYKIC